MRNSIVLKGLFAVYLIYMVILVYMMTAANETLNNVEQSHKKDGIVTSQETTRKTIRTKQRTGCELMEHTETKDRKENNVVGLGENGSHIELPVHLNATTILNYFDKRYGFNLLLSDLIGAHRSFGDCRPQACKNKDYPADLPPVSVVIIFRDEYPSIVLRTAYSVLETTPGYLLKDVVLVDDGSVDENMTMLVDIHVSNVKKFKLLRNKNPLGLMMARQRGIEASTADYFIVMDSHMEVCEGWIEPIIYRLWQEPKTLLSPIVGGINKDTLQLEIGEIFDRGFMFFSQITVGQTWGDYTDDFISQRNGSFEPIVFPVMQGMILAMKKDFFMQLGGFDPGMRVWGTEQIELSVKVWLCGGRVELVPCSRVAHMFRVTRWGATIDNVNHIAYNRHRFASTWMEGEQREIVLELQNKKGANRSNVEDRTSIKDANRCKPYQYFLDQVKQFSNIYEMKNTLAYGTVYNNLTNNCWDDIKPTGQNLGKIGIYPCHSFDNQYFILTEKCQIRFEQQIIYVMPNGTELLSKFTVLEWNDPMSVFYYKQDNTIVHKETGLCVTSGPKYVYLGSCSGLDDQLWIWTRLRDARCKQL